MESLKEFLSSIKEERMVRKGNKKIPISEIPSGETLKVGILMEGRWTNVHMFSDSKELKKLLKICDLEGVKVALEWV